MINYKTKRLPSLVLEPASRTSPFFFGGMKGLFWERDYRVAKCFPVRLAESIIMDLYFLETLRLFLLKNNGMLELSCKRQRKVTSNQQGKKNPSLLTNDIMQLAFRMTTS